MIETVLCSKCGENPRADSDSNNPWCKQCRAKYAKEYQENRLQQATAKGFAAGVDAAVQSLAAEFGLHGGAHVTCSEVAQVIQAAPRPQFRER
jgi:hypothetical protein